MNEYFTDGATPFTEGQGVTLENPLNGPMSSSRGPIFDPVEEVDFGSSTPETVVEENAPVEDKPFDFQIGGEIVNIGNLGNEQPEKIEDIPNEPVSMGEDGVIKEDIPNASMGEDGEFKVPDDLYKEPISPETPDAADKIPFMDDFGEYKKEEPVISDTAKPTADFVLPEEEQIIGDFGGSGIDMMPRDPDAPTLNEPKTSEPEMEDTTGKFKQIDLGALKEKVGTLVGNVKAAFDNNRIVTPKAEGKRPLSERLRDFYIKTLATGNKLYEIVSDVKAAVKKAALTIFAPEFLFLAPAIDMEKKLNKGVIHAVEGVANKIVGVDEAELEGQAGILENYNNPFDKISDGVVQGIGGLVK